MLDFNVEASVAGVFHQVTPRVISDVVLAAHLIGFSALKLRKTKKNCEIRARRDQ